MSADHSLNRRAVVKSLLSNRGDMLVVAGLGQCTYDCFAAGDDPRTFYLWGAMGGAVPVGLGMAIAQPERRVMVITGDGELLMGLGSLATVAAKAPNNMAVVVLDNERYGETGQQPTHTAMGTDLAGVARAAGFKSALVIADESGLPAAIMAAREAPGPVLVVVKVSAAPEPRALPPTDGAYLKHRFREAVVGKATV
ncbi:MAG: aldehyde dehydrogenase [Alphaproteobacteria bacterium]|nr:aldehyde dehydrogenase [Alphaproteobacteria bacterium]